jgi:hypothetical protein
MIDSAGATLSFSCSSLTDNYPSSSRFVSPQSIQKVFCALLFLSALFFALAFFVGVPMLTLKPQKFALSFTCGSVTFMGSFAIMKGPYEHFSSMFTLQRMPFTIIYLGSMMTTLYLTCTKGGLKGYALVIISSGELD